jgi:uncharacterized protein (TIGR00245 family)
MSSSPPTVGYAQLCYAAAPLILLIIPTSLHLKLGLSSKLLLGIIRSFLQLSILGTLILKPLFDPANGGLNHPEYLVGYTVLMVIVGGMEATSRLKWRYDRILLHALLSALIGTLLLMALVLFIIVAPDPFYTPQVWIPVQGMVLGNAISACSLGLSSLLTEAGDHADRIELLLGFGASSYEAIQPTVRGALTTALTPTLNQMTVAGLISIPGMMTGQVLGGQDPRDAAHYQIMILYVIATGSLICVLTSMAFAFKVLFDNKSRLRVERLKKVSPSKQDIVVKLFSGIAGLLAKVFVAATRRSIRRGAEGDSLAMQMQTALPQELKEMRAVLANSTFSRSTDVVLETSPIAVKLRDGGEQVLFRCDALKLRAGEMACVDGPSGCGKSQLLAAIVHRNPFVVGEPEICFKNSAVKSNTADLRANAISVPQDIPQLVETAAEFIGRIAEFRSIKSQVMRGRSVEEVAERAIEIAGRMGISRDTMSQTLASMSGGERQRAVLAAAFAIRPSILLLDEPTSALDAGATSAVERELLELANEDNVSVVIVSHSKEQCGRLSNFTIKFEESV